MAAQARAATGAVPDQLLMPRQLKDVVYARLRQQIIDFEYRPGDPLKEAELARRLGVSKTPIREALLRLHEDRLVHIAPYKGAVVAGYSREDLMHIYGLRELLEGACAREAAQTASSESLAELARIVRETTAAVGEESEGPTASALLSAFDELIYQQTRNPYIAALITNLHAHLQRIGQLTVRIPGRFARSADQHEGIYEAILRHDPEAAERQMREHVTSVMVDQLANFTENDRP